VRVTGARDLVRRVAPHQIGLLVLAASLVVAADLFGTREALFGSATPAPRAAAFSRVDSSPVRTQKTVLALATVAAFVVGYASIAFLLRFLASHSTYAFVGYRVLLGSLVPGLVAAGLIS